MRTMQFMKMEGAGNDFVVTADSGLPETAAWIASVCNRRRGIGADGMLFLSRLEDGRFRMRYFNSDGSPAGMCGNGLRCSMEFAAMQGLAGGHACFMTDAGELEAWRLAPGLIRTRMPDASPFRILTVCGYECFVTSTGVPHAVVPVNAEALTGLNANELGRSIRFSEQLAPEGANVDFIGFESPDTIRIRTYERGVEGETLACGTGMAAAGAYAFLFRGKGPEITMKTAGGDSLTVELNGDVHGLKEIFLSGPAKPVFTGTIRISHLT